jgi:hypothetical protein
MLTLELWVEHKMLFTVRIAGFRPFYVTEDMQLAVEMTKRLLDAGYAKATLMQYGKLLPIWEEDFDKELLKWRQEPWINAELQRITNFIESQK